MAIKRLTRVVFCASFLLQFGPAQPPGKGVITGKVIDGESGDPIRKAVVTLTLQGTPRRWATTRTDGSGEFLFDGLPAGKYDLSANKSGEGTAFYGVNHFRELGGFITLGEGETRGRITLRFLRLGSVSGHVYDSDGDPLMAVPVNLLRQGRNLGVPVLGNYRSAMTDNRGEFHIENVEIGQYYVRVVPQNQGVRDPNVAGPRTMLVDQYYGGGRDPKDAMPLHVAGGERISGIDFRVTAEPAVEVKGTVSGVPAVPDSPAPHSSRGRSAAGGIFMMEGFGGDGPGVRVTIGPADGVQRWSTSTMLQGPEYRFQMGDVAPGRYRIEALALVGGKTYGSSQIVDLQPNSGEIQLVVAPAVDIHGTLKVEGQANQTGPGGSGLTRATGPDGLQVQIVRPGDVRGGVSAQVSQDGTFTAVGVSPGEWHLEVTQVPPGFVKSARLGDKDVLFKTFEVGPNSEAPLNIVVSMNTSTVQGTVDAGESDAKRSGIVLAPVDARHNLARFYYGGAADENGKFKLAGLAPGKYKIFAIEKMTAQSFRTPEAADQLDDLGEVIELKEGETTEAHPKVIPAERAAKALE